MDDGLARESPVPRDELLDPLFTEAVLRMPCGFDQSLCEMLHFSDCVLDVVRLELWLVDRLPLLTLFACVCLRRFQLLCLCLAVSSVPGAVSRSSAAIP